MEGKKKKIYISQVWVIKINAAKWEVENCKNNIQTVKN